MARGGARPNSGPKPKSLGTSPKVAALTEAAKTKIREVLGVDFSEKVANESPLETLEFARLLFRQMFEETADLLYLKESMAVAVLTAPYKHQKLAPKDQKITVENTFAQLSNEQLAQIAALNSVDIEAEYVFDPKLN
jgi:hypothetical protein